MDLIEKEYNKHFGYIIIVCPTLRWNKTYHAKEWIKHDDNIWLIEPKDKLYQCIEKLPQLLVRLETLFIISDCNGTRTHNHLVRKRTLNHLAKLTSHR